MEGQIFEIRKNIDQLKSEKRRIIDSLPCVYRVSCEGAVITYFSTRKFAENFVSNQCGNPQNAVIESIPTEMLSPLILAKKIDKFK